MFNLSVKRLKHLHYGVVLRDSGFGFVINWQLVPRYNKGSPYTNFVQGDAISNEESPFIQINTGYHYMFCYTFINKRSPFPSKAESTEWPPVPWQLLVKWRVTAAAAPHFPVTRPAPKLNLLSLVSECHRELGGAAPGETDWVRGRFIVFISCSGSSYLVLIRLRV